MHLNSNLTIPPRRWYTIAQAADKLTHDLGQKITVEDMIHFLFQGYFLPFVHVKYKLNHSLIFNGKHYIDFKHNQAKLLEAGNCTLELTYDDLLVLNDYCKLALLNVDYPQNLTTKWLDEYLENFFLECGIQSADELNDDVLDRFFSKNKDRFTYGIDGLLAIKIETLYNGDASIFEEMNIIEQGLKIHHTDLLTPPLADHPDMMTMYRLKLNEPFYIPANELIIVYDGLVRIADDIRANLKLVAECMDENGKLDPAIPAYLHKGKPHFHTTPQQPKTEETQQTNKKQTKNNERSKILKLKGANGVKKFYLESILKSCEETARAYPNEGCYAVIEAVLEAFSQKYNLSLTYNGDFYNKEYYAQKLRKMGVTFPNNRGKKGGKNTAIIELAK